MQFKDYYDTLGVTRGADAEEIKRAYRKLARKFHPDVSKEKNAEAKFKEVQEAYEVLKDPEKRASYDQLGRDYRAGQQFRPPPDWEQHFGRSGSHRFSDLNGFSDFFSSFSAGCRRRMPGMARMAAPRGGGAGTLEITVEEAFSGTQAPRDHPEGRAARTGRCANPRRDRRRTVPADRRRRTRRRSCSGSSTFHTPFTP